MQVLRSHQHSLGSAGPRQGRGGWAGELV
uniref:Uncharacterized protein n=1 Tax=Anguilla anguilla TaxID=7936 RepID=A0A0E9SSR6_ANGAN